LRDLDALAAENYPADQPGAAILVEKDGQVILRKGYGLANVELGVPVSPEMVFEVGSVTKQFTAAAILMLAERGELRFDDEVTRFFPDFPTHGKKITVEHLLTHTSGIPSYTGIEEWGQQVREDITVDQLIAFFRGKPLDFEPGSRMAYNNSGYVLLGAIVEKLSGKSYEDFIEQEIFQPLGMTRSRYGNRSEVVPGRAYGYIKKGDRYDTAPYVSMTQPYAAGALLSTVDDLARWDKALSAERLLRRASLDRMFTPVRLSNGLPTTYGYGISMYDFQGHRVTEHGGDIHGFSCHLLRVPEERLFVIVLSNNPYAPRRPDALALRLAARVLGRSVGAAPAVQLSEKEMSEYVGVYRVDPQVIRVVTLEDGRLYTRRNNAARLALVPLGKDLFGYEDSESRVRFQRDAAGRITGMELAPRFGAVDAAARTDEAPPAERQAVKVDPAIYEAYVGEYALNPEMSIVILREGDQLFVQPSGQLRREILPVSETDFFIKEVDALLVFSRGADGKAAKLVLHQGGKEMPAPRVK
ncbi:MAG TPA: serine hydrolase, partial [Thermoanaerobaculia bacterium]|nr:serine hydrolase [Thermoanaerobaculia bacterium]